MGINWETAPPSEFDTALSKLYEEREGHLVRATRLQRDLDRCRRDLEKDRAENPFLTKHLKEAIESVETRLKESQAAADAVTVKIDAADAVFKARGGWKRYFLVTNVGGHIHRGMSCSSCFQTTQYGWMTELSDCDEGAMVEAHGEKACTVCFPDAPTMKGYAESVAAREAREEAEKATHCKGRPEKYTMSRYGRCAECGAVAARTKFGLRKHKRGSGRAA